MEAFFQYHVALSNERDNSITLECRRLTDDLPQWFKLSRYWLEKLLRYLPSDLLGPWMLFPPNARTYCYKRNKRFVRVVHTNVMTFKEHTRTFKPVNQFLSMQKCLLHIFVKEAKVFSFVDRATQISQNLSRRSLALSSRNTHFKPR